MKPNFERLNMVATSRQPASVVANTKPVAASGEHQGVKLGAAQAATLLSSP
jgi:hypothetical protein